MAKDDPRIDALGAHCLEVAIEAIRRSIGKTPDADRDTDDWARAYLRAVADVHTALSEPRADDPDREVQDHIYAETVAASAVYHEIVGGDLFDLPHWHCAAALAILGVAMALHVSELRAQAAMMADPDCSWFGCSHPKSTLALFEGAADEDE